MINIIDCLMRVMIRSVVGWTYALNTRLVCIYGVCNNQRTKTDTLARTAATTIFFIFILLSCKERSYDDSHTNIFEAEVNGKKVYIHKYTWGLSGNHSEIVVSLRKIASKEIDESKDIVYKGSSMMFYKVKNDTLLLLVESIAEIPVDFSKAVNVAQEEKSNRDLMILREIYSGQNFKKIGD